MKRFIAGLSIWAAGLGAAHAAVPICTVPTNLPRPHVENGTAADPERRLPIGSYTLSVIWAADRCRPNSGATDGISCGATSTNGFLLHGLWPDGKSALWPQYCSRSTPLNRATVRKYYCATPSAQHLQHEWAKHGTCMPGGNPDYYFGLSNRLFGRLRFPDLSKVPGTPRAQDIARAFASANPGMKPDMMRIFIDKEGWFQEVWLCLDMRFRQKKCAAHSGGADADAPVKIWRTTTPPPTPRRK